MTDHSTKPFWWSHAQRTWFPRLDADISVDVVIVGAGITGLTAATLLHEAGLRVALVEKTHVGSGETGRTTSHATELLDTRYRALTDRFGIEIARLAAQSQREAINLISDISSRYELPADLQRVSGYLYAESEDGRAELIDEARAAQAVGLPATITESVGLPFPVRAALHLPDQLQFHPIGYLLPLAVALAKAGVLIYEHTPALTMEDGEPCRVSTPQGVVTARDMIVATHVPLNDRVVLHTKIAGYRSYVVATRDWKAPVQPGLYWDMADPYHYTRTHDTPEGPVLITGGADHRVGEPSAVDAAFADMERYAQEKFGAGSIEWRWSGHIVNPVDGLPYIGLNPMGQHVYIATGYAGNGTTHGTFAGRLLADLVTGRQTPYEALFAPNRAVGIKDAGTYVEQNAGYPGHLLRDRLTNADVSNLPLESLQPGEGRIVQINGRKHAAARGLDGRLHVVSAVCPHLWCDVTWNAAELSWDCPCHASRFDIEGRLLNGPAARGLELAQEEEVG